MKTQIKTCPICGQEFQAIRYDQKYCSKKCQNARNNRMRKLQKQLDDKELYKLYLNTNPSRPDDFETFVEKRKAYRYRMKHNITIEYCEHHNVCYECPYPFNVCLFE